jgi:hypothetical protein
VAAGLLVVGLPVLAAGPARAETGGLTLRVASLPETVLEQYRTFRGVARPELRAALDGGVVDRVVFGWQRGIVHRQAVGTKPVRLVTGAEAAALGGRGEFRLVALRPPGGRSAWTDVEVASTSAGAGDVLVLEVGGEMAPMQQVLASLLVGAPDGTWVEPGLARRALVVGDGVPVVTASFGRPLARSDAAALFRSAGGLGLLVVRSLIDLETVPNGAYTARGRADVGPTTGRGADWREGDRLYVRAGPEAGRGGPPTVVLGWKDRIVKEDGNHDSWEGN